jgi:hypothetical protein
MRTLPELRKAAFDGRTRALSVRACDRAEATDFNSMTIDGAIF